MKLIKGLAKQVLRSHLIEQRSVASLKRSGRLFQSVGAQMENDLSPYLVLDQGTFSRPLDKDRNGCSDTYLSSSSVIYIGATPSSNLNVNNRIFKIMH